jgi:hypothetical protein
MRAVVRPSEARSEALHNHLRLAVTVQVDWGHANCPVHLFTTLSEAVRYLRLQQRSDCVWQPSTRRL